MTRRDRLMILAVLAVVLLGGFWMLVLSPQRKATTDAEAQLQTARDSLTQAQAKVSTGKQAQDEFRRDRTTIVKLGRVVPETDDIPTLLLQLEQLAKTEHVWFTSYQVDSTSGGSAGPSSSSSSSTSTSAASSSTSVPQPGSGATAVKDSSTDAVAPLYPPGSVEIDGGLGRTPITLTIKGTYFHLENYLRAVQHFAILSAKRTTAKGRLLIVDGFSYDGTARVVGLKADKGKLKGAGKVNVLKAELSASVYFAPPLKTPGSGTVGGGTSVPSTTPATPPSSTSTATIGGLR